ncbi:MAG: class I SAM-dependent methyltransferase [Deltaproteobacteria bacterium]|jgi:SAM-dependent methyltransferase|nr:class I SAM-dependent methyltransferase [Deltaproteobacteria bacterium]
MEVQLAYSPICRFCGKGPLHVQFTFEVPEKLTKNLKGDAFIMTACSSCGSFQVNPHPPEALAREFFTLPDLYVDNIDPDGKKVDTLKRAEDRREEYEGYAKAIIPFLPKTGGTILDIGAGTGLMLSLLPDKYKRIAVEPNVFLSQKAKDRGLTVVNEWAENLKQPDTPLVLIIFNQSLDHFVRPDIILGRTLNWLEPGGMVLISGLINPLSLAARITGPGFRLWHPYHQVYPTREAVVNKLASFGFETLGIFRPYFDTPFGSLPQLFKGAYTLAKAWFLKSKRAVPSPPWPGNVQTFLARKQLLFSRLKVEERDLQTHGDSHRCSIT